MSHFQLNLSEVAGNFIKVLSISLMPNPNPFHKEYPPLLNCLSFNLAPGASSQVDAIIHSLQRYLLKPKYVIGAQNTKTKPVL